MIKKYFYFVALVIAVLLLVFAIQIFTASEHTEEEPFETSSADPIDLKRFQFDSKVPTVYRIDYEDNLTLYWEGEEMPGQLISLSGLLNFRVISAREKGYFIGLQFSNLEINILDEAALERLQRIYSKPFFVEMSDEGEFGEFHFQISHEDSPGLEQIVRGLQLTLERSLSYKIEEADINGRYLSRYERDGELIYKERLSYTPSDPLQTIQFERSSYIGEIDIDGNWLNSLKISEAMVIKRDLELVAKKTSSISLQKVAVAVDPTLALWREGVVPFMIVEKMGKQRKEAHQAAVKSKMQTVRADFKAQKTTLQSLIEEIQGKPFEQQAADIDTLGKYLKAFPENTRELFEVIQSIPDELAMHLIGLLETVDTVEAQWLLREIAASHESSQMNKVRSIIALGGVENPRDETIHALEEISYQRTDEAEMELSDTAILALGNISRSVDPHVQQDLFQRLSSDLGASTTVHEKRVLLLAMQNAGANAFYNEILPFVHSDSSRLKLTAIECLKDVEQPEVKETLRGLLATETSETIREAILASLGTD